MWDYFFPYSQVGNFSEWQPQTVTPKERGNIDEFVGALKVAEDLMQAQKQGRDDETVAT